MHFGSLLTRNGPFLCSSFALSSYKTACLLGRRAVAGGGKRPGCGGDRFGPLVLKSGAGSPGVLGALPSESLLMPHVYVAPFVFQSPSMPAPSFHPHSLLWQRKKLGQGPGGGRSWGRWAPRPAALSARRLCPTASHSSLWWRHVLGPRLSMAARKLPQGASLPSASHPQCPMPRGQPALGTCVLPSPLAQAGGF